MKNLFRNIFLVSCLLLTVGAVEAQAQTVQQQTPQRVRTDKPAAIVSEDAVLVNGKYETKQSPAAKKVVDTEPVGTRIAQKKSRIKPQPKTK